MSAPRLAALLGAIRPDGTVDVHVSASGEVKPIPRAPTSLREAAELLSLAMSEVISHAFRTAKTADEIDDMTALAVYSNNWIQSVCCSLGIDIFDDEVGS